MSPLVLDTNVVSELMKGTACDDRVRSWVRAVARDDRYTTAITVAEVLLGIELLPDSARKTALLSAASETFASFGERVIAFDGRSAAKYPDVCLARRAAGTPVKELDAQIAAICLAHSCALATRSVKDFTGVNLPLVNPWD